MLTLTFKTNLRSSEDDVSRQQSSALAQEGDSLLDAEDHVRGVTLLNRLAVQPSRDLQGLGVLDHVSRDDSRAVGAPAVESLAQRPLATPTLDLPVAVRDVVADGVPEDVIKGLGLWDIRTRLANDDDQFALVVQPGALLRQGVYGHGVLGSRKRCEWFVLQICL